MTRPATGTIARSHWQDVVVCGRVRNELDALGSCGLSAMYLAPEDLPPRLAQASAPATHPEGIRSLGEASHLHRL